ncbi:hypothetical protein SAMN05443637_113174 [Pseudonocardia thermophila]|uniref:Uncharacterized protein n=1 Tax=Pseudonocardia thermophila TaxID=1848 RepID=A0A1M6W1Q3_PSETH|nr:hypothetical protein SAMN05443637_113174 [Pseudonocardia thermophila]
MYGIIGTVIVRLTAAGAIVRDVDDCSALHLETDLEGAKLRAALLTTDTGVADGEHVWLDLAMLRTRAHLLATAQDWPARWAAMVRRARDEGRLSADGRSVQVSVGPLDPGPPRRARPAAT